MSNRKQSTNTKPLFVKDRVDFAWRSRSKEGKPWEEFLNQAPIIHGGPMVTQASLALLASYGVQNWETYNHAKGRGVTVDRAAGIEVMGHKQPQDALWGFTVYPMAKPKPAKPNPASAKPKAIARPVAVKRKAKLGKLFSYQAEYQAGLDRARRGIFPAMDGFISEKDRMMANRVPCSAREYGFTYTQLAKSWNNYVKANPKCGLKETSAQKLTECGQATLAY